MNNVTAYSPYVPTVRSAFFTSFVLILLLATYSYFSIFRSQAADVKTQSTAADGFPEFPAEEQVVNIPYFVESDELQSTLKLTQ